MDAGKKISILESFQVGPSPGSVPEFSTPLSCSDMLWIGLPPVRRLTFYDLPASNSFFLATIIPGLKNSLSLALKHFPALCARLIMDSGSTKPEFKYTPGGSIPFAIAESNVADFDYLVGNQPRICSEFYPLLPDCIETGGSEMYPLVAIQVTLFPGQGFCIGITHNHVLLDGKSNYAFIKAWSSICKFGEDEAAERNELSPLHDREVMRIHTKELDDIIWSDLRNMQTEENKMVGAQLGYLTEDAEKVRTMFVISQDEIKKLKKNASSKQLSTFTVVCAYIWTCLIKSKNAMVNKVDDEEQEYLAFMADCRGRTDPVVPDNYFGNCVTHIKMSAKNRELSGGEGFITATELIRESIQQRLMYKGGMLKAIETFMADMKEISDLTKLMCVSGSPRQNHYNMDFGWGKPRKIEITSTDSTGAISLGGCRDDPGSLEVGFVLPKIRMEALTEIFNKGLQAL